MLLRLMINTVQADMAVMQRLRSVIASQEFSSSSPYRSFPPLIQFCHFQVPEIRKLSLT
jgi:hypothetical protein